MVTDDWSDLALRSTSSGTNQKSLRSSPYVGDRKPSPLERVSASLNGGRVRGYLVSSASSQQRFSAASFPKRQGCVSSFAAARFSPLWYLQLQHGNLPAASEEVSQWTIPR